MQNTPQRVTTAGFYELQSTAVLVATLKGFERHFDDSHAGKPGHLPIDWLSKRMDVIRFILEKRSEANPKPQTSHGFQRPALSYLRSHAR